MIRLLIEGKEIKAKKGSNLLWVALDNNIFIPNLCSIRENKYPIAACRLCFVEVDGINNPITACTINITHPISVHVNTSKVTRIRNSAFELLLSHHHLDCARCGKNKKCELQNIAKNLGIKLNLQKFKSITREALVDNSHPLFYFDPNKCVLCGKCVWICKRKNHGIIDFSFRGIDTIISTFAGIPFASTECISCLKCVEICPVGSLCLR